MKIIQKIEQNKVWDHWKKVEKFSDDNFRSDIRNPLPSDLMWFQAKIEDIDLEKIYIISSDDWKLDKLCEPDFRLISAIISYQVSTHNVAKYGDIRRKEFILKNNLNIIDTKLIIVAPCKAGPFTIIEGNKRAVALGSIGKIVDIEIFLGISSGITDYCWARYSHS
jgi:hypothetical protein